MGTATMTLGPLVCYGEAGHAPSQAVTLKHLSAKIPISESFGWTRFEFEFRTNQAEISNFLTAAASSGYGLNVGLTNGHRVVLNLRNSAASELTVSIMSQSKLNDLKWHRITVEFLKGEVRLTVDKLNAFEKFEHTFPETRFSFGAMKN
uniref:Laminin G domain-containing protein n=1 Tax=Acrobeloides nanus TaxID=290746 RepID=A0A914CSN7_9BILA